MDAALKANSIDLPQSFFTVASNFKPKYSPTKNQDEPRAGRAPLSAGCLFRRREVSASQAVLGFSDAAMRSFATACFGSESDTAFPARDRLRPLLRYPAPLGRALAPPIRALRRESP